MRTGERTRRLRIGSGASVALLATAALATVAAAAGPVKGATYRGKLAGSQSKVGLSFDVAADGAQVRALHITNLPIYCHGSGPPAAKLTFQAAAVKSNGTFTVKGRDAIAVGPLKGTAVATLTVTGVFASGGHESGVITTKYVGAASTCGGHSAYSTHT